MIEVTWGRDTGDAFDFTTVASLDFRVRLPGGGFAFWPWTIHAQSTTTLTSRHTLDAGGGDLPEGGTYRIEGAVVLSGGGERDISPLLFEVLDA